MTRSLQDRQSILDKRLRKTKGLNTSIKMTNENHMTENIRLLIDTNNRLLTMGHMINDLTMDKIDELLRLKTFELFGQIT